MLISVTSLHVATKKGEGKDTKLIVRYKVLRAIVGHVTGVKFTNVGITACSNTGFGKWR